MGWLTDLFRPKARPARDVDTARDAFEGEMPISGEAPSRLRKRGDDGAGDGRSAPVSGLGDRAAAAAAVGGLVVLGAEVSHAMSAADATARLPDAAAEPTTAPAEAATPAAGAAATAAPDAEPDAAEPSADGDGTDGDETDGDGTAGGDAAAPDDGDGDGGDGDAGPAGDGGDGGDGGSGDGGGDGD